MRAGFMKRVVLAAVGVLAVWCAPPGARAQAECDGCVKARYWPVDPEAWRGKAGATRAFPETDALTRARPHDLGIAFSGGGTRAATAAIGQLRGLQRNGWLARVRYMTAVSGGSWSAVPFTFADDRFDERALLGRSTLDAESLVRADGLLAQAVEKSKLAAHGLVEAAHLRGRGVLGNRFNDGRRAVLGDGLIHVLDTLRTRHTGPGMSGGDKTFARLLDKVFLEAILPEGASGRYFSWNLDETGRIAAESRLGANQFVTAADRPFLIVGGTMVVSNPASKYPALLPVEYTPLYAGVRQQFGHRVGGGYLRAWAYGSEPVGMADADHVLVKADDTHRFTLADVVASSGAAPQLTLLLGKGPEKVRAAMQRAAKLFPHFSHFAIRDGVPSPMPGAVAHGDGGFTDNLGVMPLLARGVKNVLVFVNSSSDFTDNTQLQSYFMPVGSRTGSGDRTLNHVFDSEHWAWLMKEFQRRKADGDALVVCSPAQGNGWRVRGNEHYNIPPYDGLRICWIYNHDSPKWRATLGSIAAELWPPTSQPGPKLTDRQKQFVRFPWFSTFEENRPYVIKLSAAQVNVLANLSEWAITNETSKTLIASTFSDVLAAK